MWRGFLYMSSNLEKESRRGNGKRQEGEVKIMFYLMTCSNIQQIDIAIILRSFNAAILNGM